MMMMRGKGDEAVLWLSAYSSSFPNDYLSPVKKNWLYWFPQTVYHAVNVCGVVLFLTTAISQLAGKKKQILIMYWGTPFLANYCLSFHSIVIEWLHCLVSKIGKALCAHSLFSGLWRLWCQYVVSCLWLLLASYLLSFYIIYLLQWNF